MMKLNIGCGNVPLPGYINLDKYYFPESEHPGMNKEDGETWNKEHPDSPWDFGDAVNLPFHTDTFDEVIMVHCLEHLSMDDGNKAIREAVRVLKNGCPLEIEVPDLTVACQKFLEVHYEGVQAGADNLNWMRIMGSLYGDTGGLGKGQSHLCGYSKEFLKSRMEQQHLRDIEEIPVGLGHGTREGKGSGEPDLDFRLRGYKDGEGIL